MPDPWTAIEAAAARPLAELFEAEPDRLQRLVIDEAGIRFDFSKTHLDHETLAAFLRLAEAQDLAGAREALFSGKTVNPTEGRAAEHSAERGQGAPESVARAQALHERMRALIDAIDAGAFGDIRHILHVGIGGSALGPDFIVDALGREGGRYDVAVVSNVDGAALEEATAAFDPDATLLVIASKTFTTLETMLNARSALGWSAFEELLEGAAAMDRHFRLAPPERNAPLIAAFVDRYYANVRCAQTRAVFAYDERLRLLPPYLQQLEMESNGKSVRLDGSPVGRATSQITWGGVGTDAQHAVFQLLHQGTHLVPVEFVASIEPGHALDPEHHRQLLVNCFAQGAALMAGRPADDPHRSYPGDRPSSTILLDRVDPATLGALLSFYEQRTFANAVLLGINPFDQFGVELGKEMAKAMDGGGTLSFDPSTEALMTRAFA